MQTERMSGLLGLVRGIVTGLGRRAAWRVTVLGVLLALVVGDAEGQAARRRGDRNKLTRIELDEAGSAMVTAQDAVRLLRPQWLRPPVGDVASSNVFGGAGGGATEVVLYVDGIRQPDLEVLRMVPAGKLVELRYLDQNRGVQMYGPGHEFGVIEVTTVDKRP
jgi:hypothetical protein